MLRFQYVITVDGAIEALDANRQLPDVGPVIPALHTMSCYFKSQPGLGGIGINLNAAIDDLATKAEERARQLQDETPRYRRVERE